MKIRILALMAMVAVAMVAGGCAHIYDMSDKATYDRLYADSANVATAKYAFDVPYTQIKFGGHKCDASFTVEALKSAYGADIAFGHAPKATYIVNVKDLDHSTANGFCWVGNGYKTALMTIADFTADGKTRELQGVYKYNFPWKMTDELMREICSGMALDLARQIKAITDAGLAK